MSWTGAIIVVGVVLWALWCLIPEMRHRQFRREIDSRPEVTEHWRAEFPNEMFVVDRILTIFCDAFMFAASNKFKFRPDDRIMQIYKRTTGPIADEMQLETLIIELDKAFATDLVGEWDEMITLRDVVRMVSEKSGQDRCKPAT